MSEATRLEICAVACAEAFRGDGEIMASPMGAIPLVGARLAKATFEPDLVTTDGVAATLANNPPVGVKPMEKVIDGRMHYRFVFDVVWWGKRHVMMGASQIDRFGNQNIAYLGDAARPKVQLLGMRGAPGNTINHTTSYWVPKHSKRVFVPKVDAVSGIGYDRAAELGAGGRFHEIRRVVSNLGVFDFDTPSRTMRLASIHPGVSVEEVVDQTGFDLVIPEAVPTTREPTAHELELLRNVIDPTGITAGGS
jgi:acyl CoA:acetate/3-ketoacid CoA transferase beta subunit